MPVEDFLKVIDEITPHIDPHQVMITFTGGEALIRKDIEVCGRELNKREYPWGIVSNGLLLTRERLDSLLAAGMHSITISLDGFEEAHNWLRGNRRSFEGAVNAIAMLAEEKEIVWDVVTCVNQKNFKDLMLFKDFLAEMGVKNWRIFTIFRSVGQQRHRSCRSITSSSPGCCASFAIAAQKERYTRALPVKASSATMKGKCATKFSTAMQESARHRC